ncbi:hypothetical protein brsh051_20330 [Brooklawnia propionicigenes]|uniref:TraD/TraG TraM recognition site domain-containing protein n=1 Tax=Brooklawnia propionicigenes TaxID=3041175 RepID=A0AAN0KAL1_9ACTN|nr:TraM recognition domain-containing protein [Brooklawnia sp. SH051]BEH02752.1 hypothetical protein brsh051_20330 [Brooklawnia sp. SH051]
MTTPNNRRAQPSLWGPDTILMYGTGALTISISLIMWISIQAGWRIAGLGRPQGGFWTIVFGAIRGTTTWPAASTIVAIASVLTITVAIAAGWLLIGHRTRHRTRVDQSSHYLGVRHDISPLSKASVVAKAKRLGVDPSTPGIPIGVTVASGERLYGSWEDMHVDIWGPRTGKTTSRAIPAILAAPGSVLVTSNKRDVVDATRDLRAERGPVWVFDPQHLAGEQPTWWWNPLSYVTDEVQASKLAAHFASGSRAPGARTDAFFDPAGQDLLAGLLLAAAVDHRPITDVYRWLTRPTDDTPMRLVAAAGYELTADQLAGVIFAPDKQRGGIYGTAQQMASCLTNRQIAAWITPQEPDDPRAQLRATDFVHADGGTLYSLSKEGTSTAGPLVTALTAAVAEAAENLAAQSAGGRLQTPLLGVLDEAANVCRWTDLPALYSHYGSRGIILMTILQSWSQGVDVWGESGMRKLWSAANIAIYGGGVKERDFLDTLAAMIGDYDKTTRSVSVGKGHRNVTQQLNRQRILEAADLAAMPPGRAVVFASGARPTLIATQPWMTSPDAAAIRASVDAHDPSRDTQLQETPT